MQPLYILQGLISLIILFQMIATSLFNRKRKHWIAVAQMLLGVVIIALICSQLLIIGVTFMKMFVLIGQLILLPTFWQALKEFEK